MNQTIEVIDAVEPKEGVSKNTGKPWKKYVVHTRGGTEYATFDTQISSLAYAAVGKTARVGYEEGKFGRDLKSLEIDEATPPPPEPAVRDQTPAGDPDWDLIGLRKTRCHLWGALLANSHLKDMPASTVAAFGRELIIAAEEDIYHRRPAESGDSIPF